MITFKSIAFVILAVCAVIAAIVSVIWLIYLAFAYITDDSGYKYFRERCKTEIESNKKKLEEEQTQKIAEISNNLEEEYKKRLAEEKKAYSEEILNKVRQWMKDNDILFKEGDALYGTGSKKAAQEAPDSED